MKRKAAVIPSSKMLDAPNQPVGFSLALMNAAKPWMAKYQVSAFTRSPRALAVDWQIMGYSGSSHLLTHLRFMSRSSSANLCTRTPLGPSLSLSLSISFSLSLSVCVGSAHPSCACIGEAGSADVW